MKRWLVLLTLAMPLVAHADLFSPGDLSKPHATLSGLSQCTQCHPAGGQLSQATCLTCHQELQPRLGKGLGLHGRITVEKRNCEQCHHEHQGENASIIEWGAGGEKGFNHLRTGWGLKGAHAVTKGASCLEKRRIAGPTALALMKTRPETRLGLPQNCPSCHFDEHRGQQQEDCEYCHNEKAWKPQPGFNHAETEYPLKGKHLKVKCSACHPSEKDAEPHGFPAPKSETFMRFAPLEHRTCLDCHKDPHEGRFGLRCQSCHTVDGWNVLRNAGGERQFHEKTKFPLEGAHLDVECNACHGPFPGQRAKFKGLAFEHCADCHADAHEGQLGKSPDCASCHTEQGFFPPKFGLLEHQKTRYPLEGAHQVVPCAQCHEATPSLRAKIPKALLVSLKKKKHQELFSSALFDFSRPLDRCDSCHTDVHGAQFKGLACDSCHQLASFAQVRFDHAKDSRFPLEGAHQEVKCQQCHFPPTPNDPVRYKPLDLTCRGCHLDVHAGQFSSPGAPAKCEQCHGVESWKEKLRFVHGPPFTSFVLDGKHGQAKCEACHKKVAVARSRDNAVTAVQYQGLPLTCEGCHADFHQGAFKGFEP